MMTWFLFAGDMLVMLFMVILVVWVSLSATQKSLDAAARLPLDDELFDAPFDGPVDGQVDE